MKQPLKLLIVEDEFIVANDLKIMLLRKGYSVIGIAPSVAQANLLIAKDRPDWVLLDIMLKGDLTGIDLAKTLFAQSIPFLFISANTNQSTLEAAKATQPYGFLVKPFREKDLMVMLDVALYRYQIEQGLQSSKSIQPMQQGIYQVEEMVGSSAALQPILQKIHLVAPTDTAVLITGESGTGKELVAQAIHRLSRRNGSPMVTVNCAALPLSLVESELFGHERGAFTGAVQKRIGKFEKADGGTLFLDEIGELPLDAQVKLLRVLQEKEIERLGSGTTQQINIRIIAATNRNLEKEVAEGRFRLDLYYRLNVFPLALPALQYRKDDIRALAHFFLAKYSRRIGKKMEGFTDAAMETLLQYHWPGNIRELEHQIERHVLLANDAVIQQFDLVNVPAAFASTTSPMMGLEEMERQYIIQALKSCNGKVAGKDGAAALLKIPAPTLFSKMKKFGIEQYFYGE